MVLILLFDLGINDGGEVIREDFDGFEHLIVSKLDVLYLLSSVCHCFIVYESLIDDIAVLFEYVIDVARRNTCSLRDGSFVAVLVIATAINDGINDVLLLCGHGFVRGGFSTTVL